MFFSIRSTVEYLDPTEVPSWVESADLGQYSQFAVLTVLVYDIICTMDKEIEYFWSNPFKHVTLVYFMNRYVGLFGAITTALWGTYLASSELQFLEFGSQYLHLVHYNLDRLYTYDPSPRIIFEACLTSLFVLEALTKFVFVFYLNLGANNTVAITALTDNVLVCSEAIDGSNQWVLILVDWAIPLVYGLILMALALYQAADFWKVSKGFKGLNLIKILVRDQAIYYAVVILCCISNILDNRLETESIIATTVIDFFGNTSFLCILGSRLLFNLKDAAKHGVNEGTNYRPQRSVSDINFGDAGVEASEVVSENTLP